MASTSGTGQSYNDVNVIGEFLTTGYSNTPFLDAIGFLNGARRITAQEFAMSSSSSLDAGSQGNVISETASLTAGTPDFYAKAQAYNMTQIMKYELAISNLREAANQQLGDTVIEIGGLADNTSEFSRQIQLKLIQMKNDLEFSLIQGAYTARSAVGTVVATGGVLDSTIGVSTNTVDASSAALEKDMIDELLVEMADNGAPMQDIVIVGKNTYLPQISEIYGFQPQARDIGGIAIKQIVTDFGTVSVIGTKNAKANTLAFIDMSYIRTAVLPHSGGQDILLREYEDGASAKKAYLEGFMGADFYHESYHGSITSIA